MLISVRYLHPCTWNEDRREWEDPPGSDRWGEFSLGKSAPEIGREWTDDDEYRERCTQIKHRAHGDTRAVPRPRLSHLR